VVYEFSMFSIFVISVSRSTPVALESAELAWDATEDCSWRASLACWFCACSHLTEAFA